MPPKRSNDEADAKQAIAEYMIAQNRPYNAGDVFSNLHETYGKTTVTKVLATLAEEGQLIEKANGKQKIYYPQQEQFPTLDKNEMSELDKKIEQLKEEAHELNEECVKVEAERKALEKAPRTADAENQLAELVKTNKGLLERLNKLRNSEDQVSEADRNNAEKLFDTNLKAWRSRKRMATDMINEILESYPKKRKILVDEIGLEEDAEAGLDSKTFS